MQVRTTLPLSWLGLFLCLQSCSVQDPERAEPYQHGVLVIEAGQAEKNNAAVSFIGPNNQIIRSIFELQNKRTLGNGLQSYTEIDGKGYLLVSQTNKVDIVENSTFRTIAIIDEGVEQCRYMVAAPPQDGHQLKGYVSYWGGQTLAPGVAVVSLADRRVIKAIPTGPNPEQMAVVGEQLFVTNAGGSAISVIHTATDQLVASIPVGDAPSAILCDPISQLLYVLCSGRPVQNSPGGTTSAELIRINPVTRQVVSRVSIGGRPIAGNPSGLVLHPTNRLLYFLLRGSIYATPLEATAISVDRPLVTASLSGLGIDPATGLIYGADAHDRISNGQVRRYQSNGNRIDSVSVGVAPVSFYFK